MGGRDRAALVSLADGDERTKATADIASSLHEEAANATAPAALLDEIGIEFDGLRCHCGLAPERTPRLLSSQTERAKGGDAHATHGKGTATGRKHARRSLNGERE